MMRRLLLLGALAGLSLSGCLGIEETRDDGDRDGDADVSDSRQLIVNVPDGATQIQVTVDATAEAGEPDVTLLVESASGDNLASDTFSVSGRTTRQVTVDAAGHDQMRVTVRVVDGAAELDVHVVAFVPGQPDVVVVRERIIIRVETPPTPPVTTPSPPPTVTPTPTPPTEPTPPTNATNTTNTTNETNTST